MKPIKAPFRKTDTLTTSYGSRYEGVKFRILSVYRNPWTHEYFVKAISQDEKSLLDLPSRWFSKAEKLCA